MKKQKDENKVDLSMRYIKETEKEELINKLTKILIGTREEKKISVDNNDNNDNSESANIEKQEKKIGIFSLSELEEEVSEKIEKKFKKNI
jgi:hypothetical protein